MPTLGRPAWFRDRVAMAGVIGRPDVARRIVEVRQRLGLSQVAFARLVGVSRNALLRYERDRVPRAGTLARIAQAAGVSVDWLLNGTEFQGRKPDRAWEEAVEMLRVVWRDPKRRRVALEMLKALSRPAADKRLPPTRPSGS